MILKKLNRQMLTWVTFPGYVVLFSLLIYYIGYRLRAGETEWNELHVVDVLPRAEGVDLRGRTYGSIYSPVNARYRMSSALPLSTLRGEFLGAMGGGQESVRLELLQRDSGFDAEVFVPVWTSQLLVWEWSQMASSPLEVTMVPAGNRVGVTVTNHLPVAMTNLRVVWRDRVHDLGDCPPNQTKTVQLDPGTGRLVSDAVAVKTGEFMTAAQTRQRAFGSASQGWLDLTPENLLGVSFLGYAHGVNYGNQRQFVTPTGADVTPSLRDDQALVLAWVQDFAPVPSVRQFAAVRSRQNSLLRLAVPVGSAQSP
jgi:hypothetical protein